MNGFQMTIIGVFIFCLIVGVLIFAGILPGFRAPSGGALGTVTWWGTIPADDLGPVLEEVRRAYDDQFTLNYVAKNAATLEDDLVEALAVGQGPDLVSLSSDSLVRQSAKLTPISYQNLSRQTFQDSFVLGTYAKDWELWLGPEGALGLPLYVDPLVLYFNQDLLASAKVAVVPRSWRDLAEVMRLLTVADARGNISQGGIALGSFSNINHAKDILALLLLQAGDQIVSRDGDRFKVLLKESLGPDRRPAAEAVGFFLRFVDPTNTLYAWNSSQPEAREAFLRGKLALYFGFGSEASRLAAQNPQLNFAAALPPQREPGHELTVGRFVGLALTRQAQPASLRVAQLLAAPPLAAQIAAAAGLPPAHKALLAETPDDPDLARLYQAALITRDWLDPAPDQSRIIFRRLVEAVALGRLDASRAIGDAHSELENLLPKL